MVTKTNTNIPLVTLPEAMPSTVFQPVSSMLRNCLISENPKLKELDFGHLQLYVPTLTESVDIFKGQVLVKQKSDVRYRLETKQIFNYNRIAAEEGLNLLGLTAREFDKSQYEQVKTYLTSIGELTKVSGDIHNEVGNTAFTFTFGKRYKEHTPSKLIDLGGDDFIKEDYDIIFKGNVQITFIGKEEAVVEVPPVEDDTINVASFFLHRNLGNIFAVNTSVINK